MKCDTFEDIPQAITLLGEKLSVIEAILLKQPGTLPASDQLLTIQQAADLLTLTVPTIYGYVQRRVIPFAKRGKRLYFSKAELTDWINAGRKLTQKELADNAHTFLSQ